MWFQYEISHKYKPNNSKLEYDIPYFTNQSKNLNFDDDDDEFGDSPAQQTKSQVDNRIYRSLIQLGDMHIEGRRCSYKKFD